MQGLLKVGRLYFILSKYLISSGVTHEGDPKGMLSLLLPRFWQVVTITKGEWEKIGAVDSYVAIPWDYPLKKAILFLTDVFGPQLVNNQVRSSIDVAGRRSCRLTQIDHRFSSSLTTLLLTASKLAALLLYATQTHLISIRF